MGIQLAISVEPQRLTIVCAHAAANGLLTVESVRSIEAPAQSAPAAAESLDHAETDPALSDEKLPQAADGQHYLKLEELFPDQEIDSVVAVIPSGPVLHHRVSFPFSDPKKVEAVSALQLQDLVPFDLDGYVIDNLRLAGENGGGFPHLASLVPESLVQESLAQLSRIGADPKIISTKPSAIVGMLPLFRSQAVSDGALLLLTDTEAAVSVLIDGHLYAIRNLSGYLPPASSAGPERLRRMLPHIVSTLAAVEKETSKKMARLLIVGPSWAASELAAALKIEVLPVDLSRAIARGSDYSGSLDDVAWAAGLLGSQRPAAADSRKQVSEIINFRTGKYAYRRTLADIMSAIGDEFFYISLAFLMFLVWLSSSFYASNRMLSKVDSEISRLLSQAMPGEEVPYQREVSYVEDKVHELEDQLKGIGSLSSLSPLESLEELSQTISPTIDVQVDSLSIGHSRITFSGSVPDVPSVGRLESALLQKKAEFCDVKVDPRDKVPGSTRIRFSAEIKLCE